MTRSVDAHPAARGRNGEWEPPEPVVHREDWYDTSGLEFLLDMQERHFWYRGRHRFLLHAVGRHLAKWLAPSAGIRAVDVGGGCGGWVKYFAENAPINVSELALADSSSTALELAASVVPAAVGRYDVDLLNLPWTARWDTAFLLDVLEHLPEDIAAIREIGRALAPGGLLFVTVPALQVFWTWNDDVAQHQRRYCRADFRRLADACGLELVDCRYFMFLLSPLLLASRIISSRRLAGLNREEKQRLLLEMHRVPCALINRLLAAVFAAETPAGHYLRFPWGTSLLGVFRRPNEANLARGGAADSS